MDNLVPRTVNLDVPRDALVSASASQAVSHEQAHSISQPA